MKIRTNYVSNSSSSSYIVARDLTSEGIACVKLNATAVDKIRTSCWYEGLQTLNTFSEYWLTRPIKEYEPDNVQDLINSVDKVIYCDHQMSGYPYDEEGFFGFAVGDDTVYMQLNHVSGLVVSRKQLCKILKEKYSKNQKFILNISNNSVTLEINKED